MNTNKTEIEKGCLVRHRASGELAVVESITRSEFGGKVKRVNLSGGFSARYLEVNAELLEVVDSERGLADDGEDVVEQGGAE